MNRERSQTAGRDKLSLRNLLNMELQSNYRSTNIEIRPKTMYNQRQMKIFQEERIKLMSERKLHRNSSHQITRKTEDKMEKNKLKHALGKINVLADGNINANEQDRIASIHKFFECLSKQQVFHLENFYQKAFSYIYESFKDIVYINKMEWTQQQLEFIANLTKNELIVRLYNGVKDITYKELSVELFKEMGKKMVETEQYRMQCEDKFRELESKLEDKTTVIKKLTAQVSFYQDHPSKQQYGYIAQLEQRQTQLQLEGKRAKSHIKELQNNIEYLTQYNNMLSERVQQLRIKIYDYQIVQFSNLKEIQKNSELKQFQHNVEVLKDLIHKGALRMATMREEYNKIEAYNQELLGERSVLAKRAAVGFAELTPRPNYRKIFSQFGLEYDKLVPEKPKPTTEELVTSLIKRFKQFYSKHVKGDNLEIPQRELGKKRDDPAEPIMEVINKMGKQMKKVQNLSIQVKSGYNKQKEQEQQLNKRNNK